MQDGKLLFARYAFRPNQLGYCGGPDSATLLDYAVEGKSDGGLDDLIRQFQAAYPYLQFIANSTGIGDATDPRVVEAYWLGSDLLYGVDMKFYYDFIGTQFGPRIPKRLQKYVMRKVPAGARPHHSFHVLDVSMKTGALTEQIESLDRCRISWATVLSTNGGTAQVSYQPLAMQDSKLALGEPMERTVSHSSDGKGYLGALKTGDAVSVHWDWVCDVLQPFQVRRLEAMTRYHLDIANLTV